jgi:hypothetical protein
MSDTEQLARNIGDEITTFIAGLADEGQRSAVVLGAARCDVALERLLKKVTMHHPAEQIIFSIQIGHSERD